MKSGTGMETRLITKPETSVQRGKMEESKSCLQHYLRVYLDQKLTHKTHAT